MSEQQNWHWEKGIAFALESVKAILLLNGAAAVAVLTFIGNEKSGSPWLVAGLVLFALGAASAVPTMILAYLTQLQYGNASGEDGADIGTWRTALKCHYWAYGLMGFSIVCFLVGMVLGAWGLLGMHRQSIRYSHPLMQQTTLRLKQGDDIG